MERDMDLVRRILIAMAASPTGFAPTPFAVDGYASDVVGHHVYLMAQGGLVEAHDTTAFADKGPIAQPVTITWKGHDFLDLTRNDTVWSKVKTTMKDHTITLSFALVQDLAIKYAASIVGLT